MKVDEFIEIKGARTHNLKNIDVDFPLGKVTTVTGVSGSGKSSLVFDTLYGEAYRRFVDSLSSYARQYLKSMPRPDVDQINNLPPAIAVKQTRSGAGHRSTVGTLTEINDLMRVVFANMGGVICRSCEREVAPATGPKVFQFVMDRAKDKEKVVVAASLERWKHLKAADLKKQLLSQGFTRIAVDDKLGKIEDTSAKDLKNGFVIIDRITCPGDKGRWIDSVKLALRLARGRIRLIGDGWQEDFSREWECVSCGITYAEPSLSLMSHNHPMGACQNCQGFGYEGVVDRDTVTPDLTSSLAAKGVAPWNFGKHVVFYSKARKSAEARGFDIKTPFQKYNGNDWTWLYDGDKGFPGVSGYFAYLDRKKYKTHYRIHAARFRKYVLCSACEGARLRPEALAVFVAGISFDRAERVSIEDLHNWWLQLENLPSDQNGQHRVEEAIEEGKMRLQYLIDVGLSYLSLTRSSRTLSGGELQRINMSRCLGSALTGTLFCLDEPSAGLHARDCKNLLRVIRNIQGLGNTVVMVEHEEQLIAGADHRVYVGPEAGFDGGAIVKPEREKRKLVKPEINTWKTFLQLKGVRTNNLKGIDIDIPIGGITTVCGVSGSGKSSLVQHTLVPLLAKQIGQAAERDHGGRVDPDAEDIGPPKVCSQISRVQVVSQGALGRSSRSTIGTYLGILDELRKLFAQEPLAKKHGLKPGAFSFNTKGGRCEECKGLGTVELDLSFLGDMAVTCPECQGRRFNGPVLDVQLRGRNLVDILGLTVTQTREVFYDCRPVAAICDAVIKMGLGYLTLGQNTSQFSGGEAQRLRLLSLLTEIGGEALEEQGTSREVLVFDEPTTGLSDRDVSVLFEQFRELTRRGHTVVLVEHHLEVIRNSDWLIEIGPEAGAKGGEVVYQGAPPGLTESVKGSQTAPFLWTDHE